MRSVRGGRRSGQFLVGPGGHGERRPEVDEVQAGEETWKDGKDLQKDAKVVDATQNTCALNGNEDASTYLKAFDLSPQDQ